MSDALTTLANLPPSPRIPEPPLEQNPLPGLRWKLARLSAVLKPFITTAKSYEEHPPTDHIVYPYYGDLSHPGLTVQNFRDVADAIGDDRAEPPFKVSVAKYTESHRVTYWVHIVNTATRPKDAGILDETGIMQPFYSENEEHAIHTASEWAEFLGVPEQMPCSCIMCEFKSKPRRKRGDHD